jgi:hypothetical protein
MSTCYTINNKLKYFKVYDQKSDVDSEVQHSRNPTFKHLLLTKGNQHHVFQSLTAIGSFISDGLPNRIVFLNKQYPFADEIGCHTQK